MTAIIRPDRIDMGEVKIRVLPVAVTSPELLALRATPKTLVPAPGAGYIAMFVEALILLDAGTAYVEAGDNLAIRYAGTTGLIVSEAIETTGFIDQAGDMATRARAKLDPIGTKAQYENQPLVLHNTGAAEFTTGTGTLRVKISYQIWPTGW